jgi:hypothetical protein
MLPIASFVRGKSEVTRETLNLTNQAAGTKETLRVSHFSFVVGRELQLQSTP